MNKEKLLTEFIEKNNYSIPSLSKQDQEKYRAELSKSFEFIGFVLDYRLNVFLSKLWRDIYIVYTSNKIRIIIRNQWHCLTSENDFDIIKIGRRSQNNKSFIHISILGFKLVYYRR